MPDKKEENKQKAKCSSQTRLGSLYDDAFKKKERVEKLKSKFTSQSVKKEPESLESSNKVMLKKFKNYYYETLKVIAGESKMISKDQAKELLRAMNFISIDSLKELSHDQSSKEIEQIKDSKIKEFEKRLCEELLEDVKSQENQINADNLYLFLLAIINLYEYHLYSIYKKSNPHEKNLLTENTIESNLNANVVLTEGTITDSIQGGNRVNTIQSQSNKTGSKITKKAAVVQSPSEKENILKTIQEDINGKIKSTRNYCSFDNSDQFILTFANAKRINKEFSLFYVNWSEKIYLSNKVQWLENKRKETKGTFKPKINDLSAKLFSEYRRKITDSCIIFLKHIRRWTK